MVTQTKKKFDALDRVVTRLTANRDEHQIPAKDVSEMREEFRSEGSMPSSRTPMAIWSFQIPECKKQRDLPFH